MTEKDRTYIVTRFAQFAGTSEIMAELQEKGVDASRGLVDGYNCGALYCRAAQKWHNLFAEQREKYLNNLQQHKLYHLSYRLGELCSMYDRAKKGKKDGQALNIIRVVNEQLPPGAKADAIPEGEGPRLTIVIPYEQAKARGLLERDNVFFEDKDGNRSPVKKAQ